MKKWTKDMQVSLNRLLRNLQKTRKMTQCKN